MKGVGFWLMWFRVYLDPQLPSNIPQIPTMKDHKGSMKGPLGGPGKVQASEVA